MFHTTCNSTHPMKHLAHVLKLNREPYSDEAAQGVHDKNGAVTQEASLFDEDDDE